VSACGDPSTVESGSAGTTAPAPTPTSPATTAPAPVPSVAPIASDPTFPQPDPAAANDLVGLTEQQAAVEAATRRWAFRVAERDGEHLLLTQDYAPDRVNVAVQGGTVERAWFG